MPYSDAQNSADNDLAPAALMHGQLSAMTYSEAESSNDSLIIGACLP